MSGPAAPPTQLLKPTPSAAPTVVLTGTLDELALLDALALVSATAASGVLRISEPLSADIHLVGGRIGCVRIDGLSALGDALARKGLVAAGGPGAPVDVEEVLAGAKDRDRCEEVVRDHLLELLFELSVLADGAFDFVTGVPDPWGGSVTVGVDRAREEHDRRVAEWREIAGSIPPMTAIPTLTPHLPPGVEDVEIGWAEWHVLGVLDGRATVSEVVSLSGMAPLEACRALHQLVVKGLAVVRPGP